MKISLAKSLQILTAAFLGGCASLPDGLEPISGFDVDRYLGAWYEIARLDHSFERGLTKVTAEYSRRDDGSIQVINRGYDIRSAKWREARATARFMGPADVASLKVTFFWPFGGAYHVIALDRDAYNYAMVTSSSRNYLWILARQKRLDETIQSDLLSQARDWGFRTENMIFVDH